MSTLSAVANYHTVGYPDIFFGCLNITQTTSVHHSRHFETHLSTLMARSLMFLQDRLKRLTGIFLRYTSHMKYIFQMRLRPIIIMQASVSDISTVCLVNPALCYVTLAMPSWLDYKQRQSYRCWQYLPNHK